MINFNANAENFDMKKIALLLFVVLLACSEDNNEPETPCTYTVHLLSECGDIDTQSNHFVSQNQYNTVLDNIDNNPPCTNVTITDKEGNNHSGYIKGAGTNCRQ